MPVLDLVAAVEERAGLEVVVPEDDRENSANTTAASGSARHTRSSSPRWCARSMTYQATNGRKQHVDQLGVDEHAGGDGEPADAGGGWPFAHGERALDEPHEHERLQRLGVGRARVDEGERREREDHGRAEWPSRASIRGVARR